jgi:hypothetical protein
MTSQAQITAVGAWRNGNVQVGLWQKALTALGPFHQA